MIRLLLGPLAALLWTGAAIAHGDADDGDDDAPAAVATQVPAGHAGACAGRLQLGKLEQHRRGIRTLPVHGLPPPVAWIPATVRADPRVQVSLSADQDGILENVDGRWPRPGERVRAGETLAWLRPSIAPPDRRDLATDLAAAHRDDTIGRLQVNRYHVDERSETFDMSVPMPTLQLLSSYRAAQARSQALEAGLGGKVALASPVSGRVLRVRAPAGEVVRSGEVLVELVTSEQRAAVAAYSDDDLDPRWAQSGRSASAGDFAVHLIGFAREPVTRLQQALFAIDEKAVVSVGEPVDIAIPRTGDSGAGAMVPAAAMFREGGATCVWVHDSSETFVARRVGVAADGRPPLHLRSGVADGERVVARAAALVAAGPR